MTMRMRGSVAEARRFPAMRRRWLQLECHLDRHNRGGVWTRRRRVSEDCTRHGRVHVLSVDRIQLLCDRGEDLTDRILVATGEQLNERITREAVDRRLQRVDHRCDTCDIGANRHRADVRFGDAIEIVADDQQELQQRCVAVACRQSSLEVGHGAEGDERVRADVRCAT